MPNTVVKLTNAESTWLEAAREDRKLLIKEKDICKDVLFACFHLVQGSGFRVQGCGGGFAAFFIGRCPKVIFKSPVITLISGEWIVSPVWYEILRLSPHLFWLGVFTHGAFLFRSG